jgi:hypothetical protein
LAGPRRPDLGELRQATEHAWTTFQYARYDVLARALPGLLRDVQAAADHRTGDHAELATCLLGQVYQVASSTLRKLGEYQLAHLAADRALGACLRVGDRVAPAEVRSRPAAHAVMTGILRRTKGTPPALLAALADRMGAVC